MAKGTTRTTREEIEVGSGQLVEQVRRLIREGNVRQLRIVAQDGEVELEIPLTVGVLAGGAVALAAPWLGVLGVIAALATDITIEVEREEEEPPPRPEPPKAEA